MSRARSIVLAALIGVVITAGVTQAQEQRRLEDEIEQSRALNEAKRQATIGANVSFTREESSRFWPLFWEYRTAVNKLDDELVSIIAEYSNHLKSMSDRKASKLLAAWLGVESARVQLQQEFVGKFNTALPQAKTLRVMQIENKLDAMVNLALTKRIPLVPVSD